MYKVLLPNEITTSYFNHIKTKEDEIKYIHDTGKYLYDSIDESGKFSIIIGNSYSSLFALSLAKTLKENLKDVQIVIYEKINHDLYIDLLDECLRYNIPIYFYENNTVFKDSDIFVEAIQGFNYKEDLSEKDIKLIEYLNENEIYAVSINCNFGLNPINGIVKTISIHSNLTISVSYPVPGIFLNDARDYISVVTTVSIGIDSKEQYSSIFTENDLNKLFKMRKSNSNKGDFGYTGVFGGSIKYSGAIKLSNMSLTQLVSGAGVSRVIAPFDICDSILPYLLESTLYPISSNDGYFKYEKDEIDGALKGLSSVGFGMGIGITDDNKKILEYILLNYKNKLLLDADALNLLSTMDLDILNKSDAKIVLTPHIKEFSRLIKKDVEEIVKDPIKYAREFTEKYKVVLVLKSNTTIVSCMSRVYLIPYGSVALSKGGSGDILSGVISGIMGYTDNLSASLLGVTLFGLAGINALNKNGSYSNLPSDTINELKELMKKY